MKVGIVTVYNGYNNGAFLQAYALSTYLSKKGHTVYFIKHNARKPFMNMAKTALTKVLKFRFSEAGFAADGYKKLKEARKVFSLCSETEAENLDMIIYGSDEIWNIKRKNNYKAPLFFGKVIKNANKMSYAPSLNGADEKDFALFPEYVEAMKSFKYLSARDRQSVDTLKTVLERDVETVLDPTFLLNAEYYRSVAKECSFGSPYILIYSYGKGFGDEKTVKAIKEFAAKKNLKIVSVCSPVSFADESKALSPFELLNAFDKAEYTIVDTFHGLMFSTIFKKNFAIPSLTSSKLKETVELFDVPDRVVSSGKTIETILATPVDYERFESNIGEKRQHSLDYLNQVENNNG